MAEAELFLTLLERVSQLSGPAMAGAILYLFNKKVVVWGWMWQEEKDKRIEYEKTLRDNASKIETKLAAYEERERRRDSLA